MKSGYEYNIELMQKVVPSMSYDPEDAEIFTWQKKAREKLIELIGLDRFEKVDPETEIEYEEKIDGGKEIRFTFQSEEGYRVPCHMLLPDGIENPPVMICIQGHSTGMHISLGKAIYEKDKDLLGGDRDFAIRALKEGFAAIAIEQRNFGECSSKPGFTDCTYSKLIASLFGRTTIGERVWDVQRLMDVLETEFADKIDVKTICVMGNSGGGTTTAYVAALDERPVMAVPSCAMCTFKDSIGAMPHCACNFVPHIAEYFDMSDLMAMAYPKYFIQVNGKKDDIFPMDPAKEVFVKGKRPYLNTRMDYKCAMVLGPEGHRFYADLTWPIIHKFINR